MNNTPACDTVGTMAGNGGPPLPIPLYGGLSYPGNGYPPSPGQDRPGGSPFGRLAMEQPLGKSVQLIYNAGDDDAQAAFTEILRVEGDDLDATQMCITFAAPRVLPIAFVDIPQDVETSPTTSVSNSEVSADEFPGSADPISWPPLQAVIEWGVQGGQARAIIDITNGCVINIVASFVKVQPIIAQGATVDIESTSACYQINGFIGPGWSKATNAKNTVFLGTVVNTDESAVFAVPKFAGRARLVALDASVKPSTVVAGYLRFWQSPDGQAGGNIVGSYYQTPLSGPEDVPAGGLYFSVNNQTGADMKFAVIFELALS